MTTDLRAALMLADAAMWLALLAYLLWLDRRGRRADDRIAELEREVEALRRDDSDRWWKGD